jgi:hypothetical protein
MVCEDGTAYLSFNVVNLKGPCPWFGLLEDEDLKALPLRMAQLNSTVGNAAPAGLHLPRSRRSVPPPPLANQQRCASSASASSAGAILSINSFFTSSVC